MGDRKEVLEELYVLWVEAQILQWVIPDDRESEEVWSNPKEANEMSSEEASSGSEPAALSASQLSSVAVDGPTGKRPWEGVVITEVATQSADVGGETCFDPSQFWLMLTQAGYESW